MTSSTEIADGLRSLMAEAMQISRSVIMPTTFRPSLIIGRAPQSFSHISLAAPARLSVIQMALASGVITSLTFIIASLNLCSHYRSHKSDLLGHTHATLDLNIFQNCNEHATAMQR